MQWRGNEPGCESKVCLPCLPKTVILAFYVFLNGTHHMVNKLGVLGNYYIHIYGMGTVTVKTFWLRTSTSSQLHTSSVCDTS